MGACHFEPERKKRTMSGNLLKGNSQFPDDGEKGLKKNI